MNKTAILPREHEFLLQCGRFFVEGAIAGSEPHLPPGVDWERLLQLARRNRLTAQLYRCVRPCKDRVPEGVWASLESQAQAIERNSEKIACELLELIERFRGEECPVLAYKGPVLAAAAYGDPGLRQFSDLDLLIPRRAIARAAGLLEKSGYRLRHRSQRSANAVHLHTEYHYLYRHPNTGVAVELHGEAIPCYFSFPLSNEELWQRQEVFEVLGKPVPGVSREDLALLLAMHGAKHEWQCAELILSLGCLLRASPALSWDELLSRAEALGARRVLLLSLRLAQEFFGYALPAKVLTAIDADPPVAKLTAIVWECFVGIRQPATSALATALFQVRSRERLPDRIRYWLLRIFAPNWEEVEWLPLPRALFRLYWLLRPVRLAWHYGPEVLGISAPRAVSRHH